MLLTPIYAKIKNDNFTLEPSLWKNIFHFFSVLVSSSEICWENVKIFLSNSWEIFLEIFQEFPQICRHFLLFFCRIGNKKISWNWLQEIPWIRLWEIPRNRLQEIPRTWLCKIPWNGLRKFLRIAVDFFTRFSCERSKLLPGFIGSLHFRIYIFNSINLVINPYLS